MDDPVGTVRRRIHENLPDTPTRAAMLDLLDLIAISLLTPPIKETP